MMITKRIAFSISVTLHYLFPMITIGGLFWLVIQSFSSRVFELKDQLFRLLSMGLFGVLLLANFAGWYTTEWGRQPWLIRGILRTSDAVSNAQVSPRLGVAYAFVAIALPVFLWCSYRIYVRRISG